MEEIIAIRIIRFKNRRVYTGTIKEWCELMNCNLVDNKDSKISDLLWAAEIFFDGEAEIAKRFNDSLKISDLPKRSDNFVMRLEIAENEIYSLRKQNIELDQKVRELQNELLEMSN
jgi:hypothetical protein